MARALRRRAVRLGALVSCRGRGIACMRGLAILGALPGVTTAQPTEDTSAEPRLRFRRP